jgi:multiple sugar transport system substrate-binding protein
MDAHANLWHVNLDLLAAAGLVDAGNAAILPSTPEELLEHAAPKRHTRGDRQACRA